MLKDQEPEVLERKPEDRFVVTTPEGTAVRLRVIKTLGIVGDCSLCYFKNPKTKEYSCINKDYPLGLCSEKDRQDKQNVVFIEENPNKVNEDNMGLKGALAAAMMLVGQSDAGSMINDKVLDAIAHVESGHKNGIKVKDTNGLYSYGMFQIQEPYLKDANRILKTKYTTEDVRTNPKIAKKVIKGYLSNYAKNYQRINGKIPSLKEVIAMHNGGPTGWKKTQALSYADKVLKKIDESV